MQIRKPYSQILMLCFALLAGVGQAAPLNILGVDDLTCAGWSKSKENLDQRSIYVVWMRGFLTGYNYGEQGKQVSSISSGTIEQYTNRYCASNQTGQFSDAVFRLSDQFSGRNQPLKK